MQHSLQIKRGKRLPLSGILLGIFFLALSLQLHAQTPISDWVKTFGGSGIESGGIMIPASDGGYLIGGTSSSAISGDKSESSKGGYDYWVVKVDANFNKQWDKTFGGTDNDLLSAIVPTSDGGYLLGGTSYSNLGEDKTQTSRGKSDYWIIKITSTGVKQWDKRFGGSETDNLVSIVKSMDGGYLIGGNSYSGVSEDKSEPNKNEHIAEQTVLTSDFWVIKINSSGEKQWDKTIGMETDEGGWYKGVGDDKLFTMVASPDGGYLLGGYRFLDDTFAGQMQVVKIDAKGNEQWSQYYLKHRKVENAVTNIIATAEGGYLLAGYFARYDESTNWELKAYYALIKISNNGTTEWSRENTSDYPGNIYTTSLLATPDGGYLVGGYSSPGSGYKNPWGVKVDASGQKQREFTPYGIISSMLVAKDGGFLFGGADKNNNIFIEKTKSQIVLSYTLINADTDKDIKTITDGEIIDYLSLGTKNINIKANTYPATVGSVVFTLDGKVVRKENITPYALGGDVYLSSPANYYAYPLTLGAHTLKATPYTAKSATGTAGAALEVSFTVVAGPTVVSFTLINADNDQDIRELKSGEVIDYSKLGTKNINIRANTYPTAVGSVVFNLNTKVVTENLAPYALGGDVYPDSPTDYKPYPLATGAYSLKATPYSEKYGKGTAGKALAISFTVTNGTTARLGEEASLAGISASPNPFQDRVTLQAGEKSGKVRIEVVDAVGKLQHKAEIKLQGGKAEVALPAGLPAGAYFMLVIGEGKDPQVIKLLKQ